MVPLNHNSSNGKLNKASLARLIAKCLLKTAYIVDYTRCIIELVDKTDIYFILRGLSLDFEEQKPFHTVKTLCF